MRSSLYYLMKIRAISHATTFLTITVIVMDRGRIVEDGRPAEIFSQFAKLKLLGLEVLLAAEIAYRLRSEGISLAGHIITDEELVEAICQLY